MPILVVSPVNCEWNNAGALNKKPQGLHAKLFPMPNFEPVLAQLKCTMYHFAYTLHGDDAHNQLLAPHRLDLANPE